MHCRPTRGVTLFLAALLLIGPAFAVELEQVAGAAHAYPAMLDVTGKKLANGNFAQKIEEGLLNSMRAE